MSDEKELEIEEEGVIKNNRMIIIIAAVFVLIVIAGATFLFFSNDPSNDPEVIEESESQVSENIEQSNNGLASIGTALYVGMPRPLVFNVPGSKKSRLVQIKVQLLVRGDDNEDLAKRHIPLIENTLARVFAASNADVLGTSTGKEALRVDALDAVQNALIEVEGSKVVERVLFTGFVMQ